MPSFIRRTTARPKTISRRKFMRRFRTRTVRRRRFRSKMNPMFGLVGSKSDIFPPRFHATARYALNFALSGVNLSDTCGTDKEFYCNRLANVMVGGTDKVMYWNQIATLYEYYKVTAFRYKITFTDPSQDGMYCAVSTAANTGSYSGLSGDSLLWLLEKPDTQVKFINNTGNQVRIFSRSKWIPMYKLLGVTKLQFNADKERYTGGSNPVSNPPEGAFIAVGAGNKSTDTVGTVQCAIQLEYKCVFWNRVKVGTS